MIHLLDDLLNLATAASLLLLVLLWPRLHRGRMWEVGALLLSMGICLGHQLLYSTVAEDAFITFRYAQQLVAGEGLVFNSGERVEGYSCFLWVLLLALSQTISGLPLELLARLLGGAAALGAVLVSYLLARRIAGGDARCGVAAAALLACSGSFAAYGPSGMETPLYALLCLLALLFAVQARIRTAGLMAGLALMTRPDGVLLLAVLGGWSLLRARPDGRARWRSLIPLAIPLGLLLLPWTAWRLWYYGHLIPNALAAKMGGELGLQLWWGIKYFYKFSQANPLLLVLLLVAATEGLRRLRGKVRLGHRDLPVLALPVAGTLFVIYAGGDWMPAWRYFAPYLPLACVALARVWQLSAAGQAGALPRARSSAVVLLLVSLLLWEMTLFNFDMLPSVHRWSEQVRSSSTVGAWFGRTLAPGTTLATYANGSLSYHAGPSLRVIDMLGLTDEQIARHGQRNMAMGPGHMAGDLDYVARRRPEVIMFSSGTTSPRPHCQGNPRFLGEYDVASFLLPGRDLPMGNHVNLQLLRTRKRQLIRRLSSMPGVKHVAGACTSPPPP